MVEGGQICAGTQCGNTLVASYQGENKQARFRSTQAVFNLNIPRSLLRAPSNGKSKGGATIPFGRVRG